MPLGAVLVRARGDVGPGLGSLLPDVHLLIGELWRRLPRQFPQPAIIVSILVAVDDDRQCSTTFDDVAGCDIGEGSAGHAEMVLSLSPAAVGAQATPLWGFVPVAASRRAASMASNPNCSAPEDSTSH